MYPGPGSAFEVVEAEFLLELLMRLLTDPPRLDGGGQHLERGIGRQVRQVVFLLSGRPALADEPDLLARHALHAIVEHPVLMALRNADTTSRKEACEPTSGAPTPAAPATPQFAWRPLEGQLAIAFLPSGAVDDEAVGPGEFRLLHPDKP